jgi:hypothetical protein
MIPFVRQSTMDTICPSVNTWYSLSGGQHNIQCISKSTQDIHPYPTIPTYCLERYMYGQQWLQLQVGGVLREQGLELQGVTSGVCKVRKRRMMYRQECVHRVSISIQWVCLQCECVYSMSVFTVWACLPSECVYCVSMFIVWVCLQCEYV